MSHSSSDAGTTSQTGGKGPTGGRWLLVAAGRNRAGAVVAGALLAAGSLLTRFGVFEAGMVSARDPKYTVVPQRERLEARNAQVAEGEARSVVR